MQRSGIGCSCTSLSLDAGVPWRACVGCSRCLLPLTPTTIQHTHTAARVSSPMPFLAWVVQAPLGLPLPPVRHEMRQVLRLQQGREAGEVQPMRQHQRVFQGVTTATARSFHSTAYKGQFSSIVLWRSAGTVQP